MTRKKTQKLTKKAESTTEIDQPLRPRLGIFVDANIMFSMFNGKTNYLSELLRVISMAGEASLFTSEVTRIEAAKNLAEDNCKQIAPVKNQEFRKLAKEMIDAHIPDIDMSELYQRTYKRHRQEIEAATSRGRWECLEHSNIQLMDIFSQYGQKQGLFADQTKKYQFADAIVFEQIKRRASTDFPIFIFSRDKDFEKVCRETENIKHAASLPVLFELLGIDDKVPETEGLIEGHKELLIKDISERLDTFCEIHTGELGPTKLGYIRKTHVHQGKSIRFENRIVVPGKVTVIARLSRECLSSNCPWVNNRGWQPVEPPQAMDASDTVDAKCEINVTALMYDDGPEGVIRDKVEKILYGKLLSEIEQGGYRIMRAEWKVSNKSESSRKTVV